ncbi:MAG TPA: hypothetical protein VGF54_00765 [Streptosporangiaceae bacterium]
MGAGRLIAATAPSFVLVDRRIRCMAPAAGVDLECKQFICHVDYVLVPGW